MSELALWHQANDRYLQDALAELRARLQRLAESGSSTAAGNAVDGAAHLPSTAADAEADTAAESDPCPALPLLSQRLGLSGFEQNLLLLCAALEFDTRVPALCAAAQGDANKAYPTFALALALFDEPAWDAISPERPLRYWRLIEINQPGGQPLSTSPLRADERIVNFIKGLNYLDDRLMPLLSPVAPANDLPASQQRQVDAVLAHLRLATREIPVTHLLGSDTASKLMVAANAAQTLGLTLYRLPEDLLPTTGPELEMLARLTERESQLLPIALYLDAQASEQPSLAVMRLLDKLSGWVFLDSRQPWPQLRRDTLTLEITKPTAAEQVQAWRVSLGPEARSAAEQLASQFNLNLPDIQRLAQLSLLEMRVTTAGTSDAQHVAGDDLEDHSSSLFRQVWNACLQTTRPPLDALAQRLENRTQCWDDLVLPEAEKKLLGQMMDQVSRQYIVYQRWGFSQRMSRGLGIAALFAGESGTGKTLAAEVLAHELRLNLYRIDLSQVISKYIGETEKNLGKLFDAAENGGAILFFDEADALFGKRSEVKDSHDRYANIEINYLLQRMESYRGVAILATNMKRSLDPAFIRRLRFIIQFPFPGIVQRRRIWERVFPLQTATQALDYQRLAELNLTGGSIQNIAINAAFLAACGGGPVTMAEIFEAARNEFRKLEKPVSEADFRLVQPSEAIA